MKTTDRTILMGIGLVALLAGFWFVVLSPKSEEAAELEDEVTALQESVSGYERLAAEAEDAEANFDRNYKSLVVLGKAVPSDSDTSSLFVQLNELAGVAGVSLGSIELAEGGTSAPPPPAQQTTTDQTEEEGTEEPPESESVPASSPAPPTEAAASTLPLGATVGSAGLPVMPYTLGLEGDFFGLAGFLKRIDDLVGFSDARPSVNGRLLTIDGFTLTPADETSGGGGSLQAELSITSYLSPEDQGTTSGATPAGPPPPATNTPVSSAPPAAAVAP